jgi:hypothetical protein
MTDPKAETEDGLEDPLDQLEEDADAMARSDRAIPVPGDEDDDEGVGPVTGLVP